MEATSSLLESLGIVTSTLLIGGVIILAFLIHNYWILMKLKRHGIPGPVPLPLVGNFHTLYKKGFFEAGKEWRQKYGKVYGFYMGKLANVVVGDLDILKQVLIKDFPHFTNRRMMDVNPNPVDKGLFFLKGDSWKRARNIMTPTFSSGKLKLMCNDIIRCSKVLGANFERQCGSGKSVQVKDFFGAYSMDVIASTAFGLQVDSQHDASDPFVKNAKYIFDRPAVFRLGFLIPAAFPSLIPLSRMLKISFWPSDAVDFFCSYTAAMLEERKANPSERVDFLKLLLKAEFVQNTEDGTTSTDQATTVQHKRLTTDEVIGQGFIFFVAGYETTGSLLRYVSYVLATHPDIQEQLYDEIQSCLGESEPTYETVSQLTFLDQVINETLRMYPPISGVNREASETVTINGVTIPKDAGVSIPIYAVHHDPDIYPDPEEFRPERFTPENKAKMHPAAFLPFGCGPRLCIGMRLALVEAKIALVYVLRKIKFVKSPETEVPLTLAPGLGLLQPKNPIKLLIEKRQ